MVQLLWRSIAHTFHSVLCIAALQLSPGHTRGALLFFVIKFLHGFSFRGEALLIFIFLVATV